MEAAPKGGLFSIPAAGAVLRDPGGRMPAGLPCNGPTGADRFTMRAKGDNVMLHLNHAVAHPWLCDAMGHLTTRNYVGMFDDAGYVLMHRATGWLGGDPAWSGCGWADLRNEIDYLDEVSAGTLLEISGTIAGHGKSSIEFVMSMRKAGSDRPAARLKGKSVFFDLEARRSRGLSQAMATRLAEFMALHPAS